MTDRITTVIDQDKCTGCGLCVAVCFDNTISLEGGLAVVSGSKCLQCAHCLAVCPVNAVVVGAVIPDNLNYHSFSLDNDWLEWGRPETSELVRLMASRRSCRNYRDQEVSREILEDLVRIGITAPSGCNSQKWTFTVLDKRIEVVKLGNRIAGFFRKLNRMAANPLMRIMSRFFGGNALGDYYQRHFDNVERGLKDWQDAGLDLLFHGAPAVILVGSEPGASNPAEDALLASQNILLGAHSMGLGTCLIGFAVSAMKHDPEIKDMLGIPREEQVYSVIALGYPDEKYQRLTGRRTPVIRFPEMD